MKFETCILQGFTVYICSSAGGRMMLILLNSLFHQDPQSTKNWLIIDQFLQMLEALCLPINVVNKYVKNKSIFNRG